MKIKEFTLADIGKLVQIRTYGAPLSEERIPITGISDKKSRYTTRLYFLAKVDGIVKILKCTRGLWMILCNADVVNHLAYIKIGNIDDMLTYTLEKTTDDAEYEYERILRIETVRQNLESDFNLLKELNNE